MKKLYLLIAAIISIQLASAQNSQLRSETFKDPGTYTWLAPCDITKITVQAWGAGETGRANGGGGGGAYAAKTFTVIPGNTYQIVVGKGGSPNNIPGYAGGNSTFTFNNINLVKAEGGGQGGATKGGRTSSSIGGNDSVFAGGNGGKIYTKTFLDDIRGGGGGSSAAPLGQGRDGENGTEKASGKGGIALAGGGNGGNGGDDQKSSGYNGGFPGGGGGQMWKMTTDLNNGAGADGQIIITYSGSNTYCIPTLGIAQLVDPIKSVEFNTLQNTTSPTNSNNLPFYENFCNKTTEVEIGKTYSLNIVGSNIFIGNNYYYVAFFDWNRDGNFTSDERKVLTTTDGINATIAVTIPSQAEQGVVRMRVIKTRNNAATDACGVFSTYGQIEDYSITVIKKQIDISIPDQQVTICSGVSFTVSPSDNPPATVVPKGTKYSWSVPSVSGITGAASGSNQSSVSGTLVNTTNAPIDVVYIVTPSVGNSSGNSFKVTVRVNAAGTWFGKTSDWNDAQNWCGGIPTSNTNVNIPSSGSQKIYYLPVIKGSANAKDLNLSNKATVTLEEDAQFSIYGDISGDGKIDANSGTVILSGSSVQSIRGIMFVNKTVENLKLGNSMGIELAKDSDTLNITGKVSFTTSNVSFVTNGHLTLKSTADKTASIGDITNNDRLSGNTILGDVIVERYINTGTADGQHARSWLLLSTPTLGQSINDSWMENKNNSIGGYGIYIPNSVGSGWDAGTTYAPSIKRYDYKTDAWVSKNNSGQNLNSSDELYNPNGWMVYVRGDRNANTSNSVVTNTTVRSKGNLITGDKTFTIPAKDNGFYSLGNPYASAVDMSKVDGLGDYGTFYVWVPSFAGLYGLGAYQTFTYDDEQGGYVSVPGNDTLNNFILSGQAFFVQTGNTEYNITFHENSKEETKVNTAFFRGAKKTAGKVGYMRTVLYTSNNIVVDGSVQFFSDNYSNEVDVRDGKKMNNSGINLSLKVAGKFLSVERRQIYTKADTVFFNMAGAVNGSYNFSFNAKNITVAGSDAWLEDNFTKQRTPVNLDGQTKVSFDITNDAASKATNRFRIVFKPAFILPVTFVSVDAIDEGGQVNIKWNVANEINLSNYVVMKSADGNNYTDLTDMPATGSREYAAIDMSAVNGYNYYRIRSVDRDGSVAYSEIVKIWVGNNNSSLKVFPNPIVNGVVNLRMENMPSGKYQARLINMEGKVIMVHSFEQTGGLHNEKINWDYNLAHGNYSLQVTTPDYEMKVIKIVY